MAREVWNGEFQWKCYNNWILLPVKVLQQLVDMNDLYVFVASLKSCRYTVSNSSFHTEKLAMFYAKYKYINKCNEYKNNNTQN